MMRARFDWRSTLRRPLVAAVFLMAATLSLTGAFGSFSMVMPLRLTYWLLTVGAGGLALLQIERGTKRFQQTAILHGLVTVAGSALATGLAAGGAAAVLLKRQRLGPADFVVIGLSVALPLYSSWRLLIRTEQARQDSPQSSPVHDLPDALATKLPVRLALSELIAIEAQDHYLRVITRDGEALVHMRFAEVGELLRDHDGMQVHRSWWVATRFIEDLKLANSRGELIVEPGLRVPVSRTFLPTIRQRLRRKARDPSLSPDGFEIAGR